MFKKKRDQPLPFTRIEGPLSIFEDPQTFRVPGGAAFYRLSLTADRPDVELKVLIPVIIQVRRKGESIGTVSLGTLRLHDLRKLVADKLRKIWGVTRKCPQVVTVPLNQAFTVKDVKFNVVLKAKKEVKHR